MRKLLAYFLIGALAAGCSPPEEGDDVTCEGDKCDGATGEGWSSSTKHIVPKQVYEYLQKYQWGDYHLVFHMSRRFFIAGDNTRRWLESLSEKYADLQEGDPGSGIEFLAMHRAMIEHLREKFGDVALPESIQDGDGFKTMGEVLDGWNTDEKMIAQIQAHGGNVEAFRTAAAKLRDTASFASEDEFGLFLQTSLRLSRMVDETNTEKRFYDRDSTSGAGIHNSLHGTFAEAGSPIDVGDPGKNLGNVMFWGIHGYIEAAWKNYEAHHTRTSAEQAAFSHQLERFRLHMQLHSDFHEQHQTEIPRAPAPLRDEIKSNGKAFRNGADCADLDPSTTMPDCT